MDIEKFLGKYGLSYEQLNEAEKTTLDTWMDAMQSKSIGVSDIREYLNVMRDSVEQELIDEPEFVYVMFIRIVNRKHILLKARLRNYLLLMAFLDSPIKARKAIENQLNALASKKR